MSGPTSEAAASPTPITSAPAFNCSRAKRSSISTTNANRSRTKAGFLFRLRPRLVGVRRRAGHLHAVAGALALFVVRVRNGISQIEKEGAEGDRKSVV